MVLDLRPIRIQSSAVWDIANHDVATSDTDTCNYLSDTQIAKSWTSMDTEGCKLDFSL